MRHAMFFFEVTMSYVLAIDVGTSFTAAAVLRPGQGSIGAPEVLPLGLHGSAVPSVLYYAEDGRILVGEAAERRGLDDPRRMVREFKRRIGDSVPMAVGDDWLAPEDVFATLARWVSAKAEEREGSPATSIVMTHPASWGRHRTSVVLAALISVGLGDVRLISEPEAAALHYASQTRVEDGSTIAVYDLGGGTFDTAILRKAGAGRFELIGHPDGIETLGGADFDAAVLRHVVAHLGGAISALDADDPATLAALSRLKRECREAKEALSLDSEASISVAFPGMQAAIRLVRSEFEAMIQQHVHDTLDALLRSLQAVSVEPEDLTAVLLIGGSSRIPLVAELVSAELERPVAVDADPKSSICLGAAISASAAVSGNSTLPAADGGAGSAPASVPAVPGLRSLAVAGVARPGVVHGRTALSALKQAAAGTSRPGRHAPRSRMRMTAAAAAAATVLTVITATAAQTPDGAGLLSMFAAQGADVMRDGGTQAGGGQSGGASGDPAAAAPVNGQPRRGLDASADRGNLGGGQGNSGQKRTAGSGSGAVAGAPGAGSGAAAPAPGIPGAATPGIPVAGSTAPGTSAPGTSAPVPTAPGGAASGPTPEPTTQPPATQPPVTQPPTTPADPPPTTVPDPVTPAPTTPAPEPTTQAPLPPATQDPVPSDPVTEPAPPPATEANPSPTVPGA
ncbi:Hsp70 family protein [Paenarthrobacter sp. NPDC058040]|uniref:Hsp70 family protein n=1 Tax=unclassified Paenarthrobacter TaxID=2634190 RepID=UPI0036DC81FB